MGARHWARLTRNTGSVLLSGLMVWGPMGHNLSLADMPSESQSTARLVSAESQIDEGVGVVIRSLGNDGSPRATLPQSKVGLPPLLPPATQLPMATQVPAAPLPVTQAPQQQMVLKSVGTPGAVSGAQLPQNKVGLPPLLPQVSQYPATSPVVSSATAVAPQPSEQMVLKSVGEQGVAGKQPIVQNNAALPPIVPQTTGVPLTPRRTDTAGPTQPVVAPSATGVLPKLRPEAAGLSMEMPPIYPQDGLIRPESSFFRLASTIQSLPRSQGPELLAAGRVIGTAGGNFVVKQPLEPMQPIQPVQPVQPFQPPIEPFQPNVPDTALGDPFSQGVIPITPNGALPNPADLQILPDAQTIAPSASPSANNTAELLQQADSIQTVNVRRRSAVSFEPTIRGYNTGQIYTDIDQAFYIPVRRDIDTILSKVDPGLIDTVSILPGPYGLRYGPGFAFVIVDTLDTPRYEDGAEMHSRLNAFYSANGQQWYGRETIFGGGEDWGFRFSYGNRNGADYRSGNNTNIPSSYLNQDWLGQFGYNFNDYQRIEVAYNRFAQDNTQYAAQFFDVDWLYTNSYRVKLQDTDPFAPWDELRFDGWYNRTKFAGDTLSSAKRYGFNVLDRVDLALNEPIGSFYGFTNGSLLSTGGRGFVRFGDPGEGDWTFTVGADFRQLKQGLAEQLYSVTVPVFPPTNLPSANFTNPGLFMEVGVPLTDWWLASIGGRVDYVRTKADASRIRPASGLFGVPGDLLQENVLYSYYLSNEFTVSDNTTMKLAAGYAQRPPTLEERYADGIFLAIAQNGFSRVFGTPSLNPERNWQVDAGVSYDNGWAHASVNAYHAFIVDYITYAANPILAPTDARQLRALNTPFATLAGFNIDGWLDVTDWLSPYAALMYTDGRDRTIHTPLPAISPMEGRIGIRLHDTDGGSTWGIDFGARIVNAQNRLAAFRVFGSDEILTSEGRTPAFTVSYLRCYLNATENLRITTGIENVFNQNYLEHLDLRLNAETINGTFVPATFVYAPGFSPYLGIEWLY